MMLRCERRHWFSVIFGGTPSPRDCPKAKTSLLAAPITLAIRSMGISGQLRQIKACKRRGKCGTGIGVGPLPAGNSAMELKHRQFAASTPAVPAVAVVKNSRREYRLVLCISPYIVWAGGRLRHQCGRP